MSVTIADLAHLLTTRGTQQYGGEAINQLEHALQCAQLAQDAGDTTENTVAALLHDVGHLIGAERDGKVDHTLDNDDLHQYIALPFLRGLLPPAVLEPIRLHVDAKRYLCATDLNYWAALSPTSKRTLELQGGPFTGAQAHAFIHQPFAAEAVRVRKYDDLGKVQGMRTRPLEDFMQLVAAVAQPTAAAA